MKNQGKIFEQNFRKSIPINDKIYYYRLKDTASSYYGGNDNLRFSQNNIADAIMFYVGSMFSYLFILEFKSHKGKSLPLTCIRKNQLEEMSEASKKIGVRPILVVFFSDIEKCYALDIEDVNNFTNSCDRKSIPIEFFDNNATEIETIKLRTNYKYNIEKWLQQY